MRIRTILASLALVGAASTIAGAQAQPDTGKKPGGLNKVAHDVSKTFKKAGRDTKAEVKRTSSRSHQALTKAGNDTKAELKRTTGVTSKSPDSTHKPGGLNKLARDVSHAGKKTGAHVKHATKKEAAHAHHALTATGKGAKEVVKDSIKP